MARHNELGKQGERQALQFLAQKGYTILESNWRYQKAEVDIIAQKGDILAVVEVKTRSSTDFGNPQDFVNSKKIKLLVTAIDAYVIAKDLDVDVRFDIVAIVKKGNKYAIEHLEAAFLHF